MQTTTLAIPGLILVRPKRIDDDRGFLVETYRQDNLEAAIIQKANFVQENCSFSKHKYTVRGLHAQKAPNAQGKLVSCRQGAIRDIVVDIRPGSKTYGQSLAVELSADNMAQLWVPVGFLHGFATLEPSTEVHYKCTDYYAPDCAIFVNWQDTDLNIDWGFDADLATLSEKDRVARSFRDFELGFLNAV